MESWFATLKKEKIYQLDTTKLTVEKVKTIVWRYTFAYYNFSIYFNTVFIWRFPLLRSGRYVRCFAFAPFLHFVSVRTRMSVM